MASPKLLRRTIPVRLRFQSPGSRLPDQAFTASFSVIGWLIKNVTRVPNLFTKSFYVIRTLRYVHTVILFISSLNLSHRFFCSWIARTINLFNFNQRAFNNLHFFCRSLSLHLLSFVLYLSLFHRVTLFKDSIHFRSTRFRCKFSIRKVWDQALPSWSWPMKEVRSCARHR